MSFQEVVEVLFLQNKWVTAISFVLVLRSDVSSDDVTTDDVIISERRGVLLLLLWSSVYEVFFHKIWNICGVLWGTDPQRRALEQGN